MSRPVNWVNDYESRAVENERTSLQLLLCMSSSLLQTPQADEGHEQDRKPVAGTSSGRKTDEEETVAGTSSGRKKYTKYTVSYEEFWEDFWEDYEDFWK